MFMKDSLLKNPEKSLSRDRDENHLLCREGGELLGREGSYKVIYTQPIYIAYENNCEFNEDTNSYSWEDLTCHCNYDIADDKRTCYDFGLSEPTYPGGERDLTEESFCSPIWARDIPGVRNAEGSSENDCHKDAKNVCEITCNSEILKKDISCCAII